MMPFFYYKKYAKAKCIIKRLSWLFIMFLGTVQTIDTWWCLYTWRYVRPILKFFWLFWILTTKHRNRQFYVDVLEGGDALNSFWMFGSWWGVKWFPETHKHQPEANKTWIPPAMEYLFWTSGWTRQWPKKWTPQISRYYRKFHDQWTSLIFRSFLLDALLLRKQDPALKQVLSPTRKRVRRVPRVRRRLGDEGSRLERRWKWPVVHEVT